MAIATAVRHGHLPAKFPVSPKPTAQIRPISPIFISTNSLHVNLLQLKELYTLCNHSGHRFPNFDSAGKVEPVDLIKLRTAISHSPVVVSAFTNSEFMRSESNYNGIGGQWIRKIAPVSSENGRLIGFGRAVSDSSLTASIYDVMVIPHLRCRGIGRMILQRIIRMLTSKDIYDIAALCTDNERAFFKACGFGDDMLGSTTMMYGREPSGPSKDEEMVSAGRKLLLVPSPRKFLK